MNIHLHVERLVLSGLPVTNVQASTLRAAAETELARLFAEKGLSRISGGAVPHLSAGSISWPREVNPTRVGQQIALAVYEGVSGSPQPQSKAGLR